MWRGGGCTGVSNGENKDESNDNSNSKNNGKSRSSSASRRMTTEKAKTETIARTKALQVLRNKKAAG